MFLDLPEFAFASEQCGSRPADRLILGTRVVISLSNRATKPFFDIYEIYKKEGTLRVIPSVLDFDGLQGTVAGLFCFGDKGMYYEVQV